MRPVKTAEEGIAIGFNEAQRFTRFTNRSTCTHGITVIRKNSYSPMMIDVIVNLNRFVEY